MVYKKYCFVKECYIGILTIDIEKDTKEMRYITDESKLSEYAKKWIQYYPLDTKEKIELFISDRVISERREDRAVWLNHVGLKGNESDIEIFMAGHGISNNDMFWIDDKETSEWWYTTYKDKLKAL